MRVVGEDAKAFGRDVGAHTEGRRNNIESYRYVCMYVCNFVCTPSIGHFRKVPYHCIDVRYCNMCCIKY